MEAVKFTGNEIYHPFTFVGKLRKKVNLIIQNFTDKVNNATATDTPTINAEIGTVTPAATAIAAGATREITVTNNKVTATSVVLAVVTGYAGAGTPIVQQVSTVAAGSFKVELLNAHASVATDASIKFFFVVL